MDAPPAGWRAGRQARCGGQHLQPLTCRIYCRLYAGDGHQIEYMLGGEFLNKLILRISCALEYSIERLTCTVASRLDAGMVG